MERFERELKRLPVSTPSPELKSRIFSAAPRANWLVAAFGRRIPLGWAAVFAMATGAAGTFFSQSIWAGRTYPSVPVVRVNIIKGSSDRNLFDFTAPAADFIPGELTVKVQPGEEI